MYLGNVLLLKQIIILEPHFTIIENKELLMISSYSLFISFFLLNLYISVSFKCSNYVNDVKTSLSYYMHGENCTSG